VVVVIGLGSPFLTDDAVGPRVVHELARQGGFPARLTEAHAGGLLLEELEGEDRAVVVDAVLDPGRRPGQVLVGGIGGASHNAACAHDCDLPQALAMGRALGMRLPPEAAIHMVGIVAGDVATFSERLTPAVEAALGDACAAVRACLAAPVPSPIPEPS
jgi:hydrogenase maturation protease